MLSNHGLLSWTINNLYCQIISTMGKIGFIYKSLLTNLSTEQVLIAIWCYVWFGHGSCGHVKSHVSKQCYKLPNDLECHLQAPLREHSDMGHHCSPLFLHWTTFDRYLPQHSENNPEKMLYCWNIKQLTGWALHSLQSRLDVMRIMMSPLWRNPIDLTVF